MTLWRAIIVTMLFATTIASAEIIDVSCVFETTEQVVQKSEYHSHQDKQAQKPEKWFFWRTDNTVEVANEEQSFGEKWTITDNKHIFYQALYYDKKFLLDFQPTDLKILNKKTNWKVRSTIFPQRLLKQLRQKTTSKFNQYDKVRYEGEIAGIEYKVDWLPELNLPARLEKSASNKFVVIELKEVYPLSQSPYKQQSTDNYDDMDYADIGDNESHPIAAQLQNSRGIGYSHQH